MNLQDYQQISLQGLAIKDTSVAALAHRSLGLSGEAGEIANRVKKIIRDNNGQLSDDDREIIREKLGDTFIILLRLQILPDLI